MSSPQHLNQQEQILPSQCLDFVFREPFLLAVVVGHVHLWWDMCICGCVAASSCETYEYPQHGGGSAVQSVESMNDGYNSYLVSWPWWGPPHYRHHLHLTHSERGWFQAGPHSLVLPS